MMPPKVGELFTVTHTCVNVKVGPYRFIEVTPEGKWDSQRVEAPNDFLTWLPMACGSGFGEWQPYVEAVAS